MATELVTIVFAKHTSWGYYGDVVQGNLDSYYPSSRIRYWRPTAAWAKRRGDRKIRNIHRRARRIQSKSTKARRVTGYGD